MNRPLGKRLSSYDTNAWCMMQEIGEQYHRRLSPRLHDRLWAPLDFQNSALLNSVARRPLGRPCAPRPFLSWQAWELQLGTTPIEAYRMAGLATPFGIAVEDLVFPDA